jgi:hypothetical protein
MFLAYSVSGLYSEPWFEVHGEDFAMGAVHSAFRANVAKSNRLTSNDVNSRDGIRFSDDCYEGNTNAAFVYAIVAFSVLAVSVVLIILNL